MRAVQQDVDGEPEWIKVLSATIEFPEGSGMLEEQLILFDHEDVAGLDELLDSVPEYGMHIIGPKPASLTDEF
jgi:hypothetical protein